GPNFNGNLFAEQALSLGAAYAIVDEVPNTVPSDKMIVVTDVLSSLQQLAKYHRLQFSIPFIAITGSNGKTTTKELVHVVLSKIYKTYTTEGNLNNHIGIPLTILKIKQDAQMAVIEMGANHQKEIESYCEYVLPNWGLITNCGKAHLEGFGGEEGVKKGKGELYQFLKAKQGGIFMYADYDYLNSMSTGISKIISYGTNKGSIVGNLLSAEPFLNVHVNSPEVFDIHTQLVGAYNLPNVLAAIAVGCQFGVPVKKIKEAIENYVPSNSRSQLIEKNSNHIILDAYNANPSSMQVAIQNFAAINNDSKILLLGAMMELGETSVQEHQQLITLLQKFTWKAVVLVGGDFKFCKHGYIYTDTNIEAKKWLENFQPQNSYILIKGSRSMKMELIIQ
ncbi:MAG: UDP-N-acetylmuramoyl-tripeptide--D-alanyl-D-alanine ligase, partial [Chitinophagaceae bacterium]